MGHMSFEAAFSSTAEIKFQLKGKNICVSMTYMSNISLISPM
jgi:hypothetical protein